MALFVVIAPLSILVHLAETIPEACRDLAHAWREVTQEWPAVEEAQQKGTEGQEP